MNFQVQTEFCINIFFFFFDTWLVCELFNIRCTLLSFDIKIYVHSQTMYDILALKQTMRKRLPWGMEIWRNRMVYRYNNVVCIRVGFAGRHWWPYHMYLYTKLIDCSGIGNRVHLYNNGCNIMLPFKINMTNFFSIFYAAVCLYT